MTGEMAVLPAPILKLCAVTEYELPTGYYYNNLSLWTSAQIDETQTCRLVTSRAIVRITVITITRDRYRDVCAPMWHLSALYWVRQKVTPFWYLSFPRCSLHYISYSGLVTYQFHWMTFFVRRCKQFYFMRINCNFAMTAGLTNDERCWFHNPRVEKHRGSERNMKIFFNKWVHLNCKWSIANVKVVHRV